MSIYVDITCVVLNFFFFNDTATTEIYTLSLHDALPISSAPHRPSPTSGGSPRGSRLRRCSPPQSRTTCRTAPSRSEEHTSELQSQSNLVCRLLLEKKMDHSESHVLDAGGGRAAPVCLHT